MADAKDLEIEISTEGVRSLLEIGFDLGVAAALAAIEGEGREAWRGEIPNPFRRASTVIEQAPDPRCEKCGSINPSLCARLGHLGESRVLTQLERVKVDVKANARVHGDFLHCCVCGKARSLQVREAVGHDVDNASGRLWYCSKGCLDQYDRNVRSRPPEEAPRAHAPPTKEAPRASSPETKTQAVILPCGCLCGYCDCRG